jgi:hypothetical protein
MSEIYKYKMPRQSEGHSEWSNVILRRFLFWQGVEIRINEVSDAGNMKAE